MIRLRLVHWNAAEAAERAQRLRAFGFDVESRPPSGTVFLRELRARPPAAVLIDLTRLPSQGRDLGLLLRKNAATRAIPLVFVGGEAARVAALRALLPDATFASWSAIAAAVRRACARAVEEPVQPDSVFAAYAGKPLAVKLGIRPGSTVGLVAAPAGFAAVLGTLPADVTVRPGGRGACDVLLGFVRTRKALERGIDAWAARNDFRVLWIVWPKRTGAEASDVGQAQVRAAGLARGLVDYKICAVDATWSGLAFTHRAAGRKGSGRRPSSR